VAVAPISHDDSPDTELENSIDWDVLVIIVDEDVVELDELDDDRDDVLDELNAITVLLLLDDVLLDVLLLDVLLDDVCVKTVDDDDDPLDGLSGLWLDGLDEDEEEQDDEDVELDDRPVLVHALDCWPELHDEHVEHSVEPRVLMELVDDDCESSSNPLDVELDS